MNLAATWRVQANNLPGMPVGSLESRRSSRSFLVKCLLLSFGLG
jgi:hypothetical protein